MAHAAFVGNLPPTMTEGELAALFGMHGAVAAVRLPRDREGRIKAFGFVDLADSDSLTNVIRNLNGMEVHGRALRVDAAGSRPGGAGAGGGGAPRDPRLGRFVGAGGAAAPRGGAQSDPMSLLALGANANPQAMSAQINSLSALQLWEIVSQMKALVEHDAEQARAMLVANPPLGLMMLKAQMRLGMVTATDVTTVVAAQQQQQQQPPLPQQHQPQLHPPPPPPPPQQQPVHPPQAMVQQVPPPPIQQPLVPPPPPPPQGLPQGPAQVSPPPPPMMAPPRQAPSMPPSTSGQPPPPPPVAPPVAAAAPPRASPSAQELEQQALLQQVMQLTPQQIEGLPADQRAQIEMLRRSMGHMP